MLPSSMTSNSILLRERLSSLSSRTSSADRTVTGAEGRRSLLQEQAASVLERKESAESLQETLTLALAVLQELEQAWRRSFEQRLSSVGSEGLSAVFGADIKMRVESKTFRDATSMKLMLIEDGIEIDEPADGTGGSVVMVQDVLLKILMLVSLPGLERVLVLDEPFRMIEARHLPALGQLLRQMWEQLGVQTIFTSHEPEMLDAADVAYEVRDGTVKRIKSQYEERE